MFSSIHKVEITESENKEEVTLKVFNLNGVLLSEFFIKKLPDVTAEEVAQEAYASAYGKVENANN
jgi:hypothetical protein